MQKNTIDMQSKKWKNCRRDGMIEIKNAIVLAAGMSTRMEPLSYETPKALIKIRGEVLIERQIKQLIEADIHEIIVVVGYQKEKFEYLKEKFGVQIVYNPYFQERNNHSSLFVVKEYLENTYLTCGDYYFKKNPFKKNVWKPYYGLMFQEGSTKEWCVEFGEENQILDIKIGGKDAWALQGEVCFDKKFSDQLIPLLEEAMKSEESKDSYWEDLYLEHRKEMILFGDCKEKDQVFEFDSLMELREKFPEFHQNTTSTILHCLSQKFGCSESDMIDFFPLKREEKVEGFLFRLGEREYEYYYETEVCKERGEI